MFLVLLLILLGERVHVVTNVTAKDVALVDIGIQLTVGKAGEALGRVGNVQTGIGGALENAKDAGTGRGTGKTSVQVATE